MEGREYLKVKGAKPLPFPEHLDLLPLLSATERWPLGIKMLLREIFLWWEFVRYDFSSAPLPGLAFGLAAWKTASVPMTLQGFLLATLRGLVYIALYIYTFNLSNQLIGIAEDRIGKPDRPLVRGLCTPRGAWMRWIAASLLFLLLGWLWGVWLWAAMWLILGIWHNFLGGAKHWVGKNLLSGLGTLVQLAAMWQLSAPLTTSAWIWIITIAIANFALIPMQDLRDLTGDRVNGRRTFPMVFGETFTRTYLAVFFFLLPLVVFLVLIFPFGITWIRVGCGVFLAALNWVTAWRVLVFRSPSADHYTYLSYCYWYTFAQLFALILF